jgi:4-hydroxy-3-polyprenylbenzoate decarboxylase
LPPITSKESSLPEEPPIVIGVTGASGAPIARAVLEALRAVHRNVALVISAGADAVLAEETDLPRPEWDRLAGATYRDSDLGAAIASGSRASAGMAIVPCSGNTVAKLAVGLSDTLITRAAAVHLKERRKLVIVPRETPLSTIQLRHLASLSELGVTVVFAAPPYYTHPRTVQDMTDYLAGKVLDQLGVPHQLYRGWRAERP